MVKAEEKQTKKLLKRRTCKKCAQCCGPWSSSNVLVFLKKIFFLYVLFSKLDFRWLHLDVCQTNSMCSVLKIRNKVCWKLYVNIKILALNLVYLFTYSSTSVYIENYSNPFLLRPTYEFWMTPLLIYIKTYHFLLPWSFPWKGDKTSIIHCAGLYRLL